MRVDVRVSVLYFLLLLVAADAAFVLLHVVNESSTLIENRMYSLDRDRGYAEFYQYIKLYWVAVTLAALAWRTRALVYAGWIAVFGYLLLDDAAQIHERVGEWIAARWGYPELLGLRPVDLGELTVSAAVGLALLVLLGVGYWRGNASARNASQDLVVLIGVLVFFGIAFDMLHQIAGDNAIGDLFVIAEDGGEMLTVSVIAAYAGALLLRGGRAAAPLWRAPAAAFVTGCRRRFAPL
ncbi:MAG: hypothetical protein JXB36_09545 [Gammaproteobacteria bacterium]|nr:hypothetical protein [Gammaproteobacteria bacterium]